MGDDPYDFAIALPSGGFSRASDSDASDASGSDSEDGRRGVGRRALDTTTTTTSGSALDKAQSFLSKYAGARAARRVEMSLDDLSLDSSGDESPMTGKRGETDEEEEDEEEEEPRARRKETAREQPAAAAISRQRDESTDSEEERDERPAREKTAAVSTWAPSVVPRVTTQQVESDSEEQEEEEEEIASQSEVDESGEIQRTAKPDASFAASESDVYEDEGFEDASANAADAKAELPEVAQSLARPPEEDSHANYSLDFTEDGELPTLTDEQVPPPSLQPHESSLEDDRRSEASSSNSRNKDSYVEEDESEAFGVAVTAADGHRDDLLQPKSPEVSKDSDAYGEDDRFESESQVVVPTPAYVDPSKEVHRDPVRQETLSSLGEVAVGIAPTPATPIHTPQLHDDRKTRPRVQIIREYQQNSVPVEKRDASTQFTGNHASIQTDLTPYGMATTAERRWSREDEARLQHPPASVAGPPPARGVEESRAPAPTQPPPPPSPFASYGLYDPLQLPAATSMSIYKQQLFAIQQQIHQKKLETEQLFRERLGSRYSSLHGTDKFISSNRPPRMQLWEALMRVDPSLDERKAKEVARMASGER